MSSKHGFMMFYQHFHGRELLCTRCVSHVRSTQGQEHQKKPPLKCIPVGEPFQCLGMDVSGDGNRYALVFQNYLTKWPEAFAAKDKTATTIA